MDPERYQKAGDLYHAAKKNALGGVGPNVKITDLREITVWRAGHAHGFGLKSRLAQFRGKLL